MILNRRIFTLTGTRSFVVYKSDYNNKVFFLQKCVMHSKTVYLLFAFVVAIAAVAAYTNDASGKTAIEKLDNLQNDVLSEINQSSKRNMDRATFFEACPDSHCICAYTEKGGDVLYEKCDL
ncbi:hypothetical protein HOLleu_22490 [Holothuria leucospilota]|uniref:Uncharacterized protein n=1 Tax=Holothuria leucospilota TaxID=206669 RepID=A0A9Q1H6T6_HOLLE|nr:hypothetical protein HOLleu_22490 [Holothuria leucospilota]